MIEHVVLFKPKRDTTREAEDGLLQRLRQLPEHIPEIRYLSAGRNTSGRGAGFTSGLVSQFDSEADLAAYQAHPDHQAVLQTIHEVMEQVVVLDYPVEIGRSRSA